MKPSGCEKKLMSFAGRSNSKISISQSSRQCVVRSDGSTLTVREETFDSNATDEPFVIDALEKSGEATYFFGKTGSFFEKLTNGDDAEGTNSPDTSNSPDDAANSPAFDLGAFTKEVLDTHNQFRAFHGVDPLQLNEDISKVAQEWADHLSSVRKFYHRPDNKYGENLFYAFNSDPKWVLKGEKPVSDWYEERTYYKYGADPDDLPKVAHFTQVVWKSSSYLGVGYARKNNYVFVVCNYDPPGNYHGKFGTEVLPRKGE